MLCPRCHTENREGRRFCGECGLSFATTCPPCGFLNEGGENDGEPEQMHQGTLVGDGWRESSRSWPRWSSTSLFDHVVRPQEQRLRDR
jgi:hypothetical protein